MGKIIKKQKILFAVIGLLFLTLMPIYNGTNFYQNIKGHIYKESLSEERQANYDKMKIEYVNVKNRVTGTEPFNIGDSSDTNGVDVTGDDNYIRTFDVMKYTLEMGIIPNTSASGVTEESVFEGGVIKVRAKLPNQGNTTLMRFDKDAWMQNVSFSNDNTEIYAEYHVPKGVSITNANQKLSFTVKIDGYKKEVTSEMAPTFEVWMEGNKPDDSTSNAISQTTKDNKNIIISGKVSLDAHIINADLVLYRGVVDGHEGRYNTFALSVALSQPVSNFSDLRGVEYPSGPLEVNLDASYKAMNINDTGSDYQQITSATENSLGVLNGTSINISGYNGGVYNIYPSRGKILVDSLPAGKRGIGYSNEQSVLDSGTANIDISENSMKLVFNNYKLTYNSFPTATSYSKNNKLSTKQGYFIAEAFQLFMPLYDYSETSSYDYNLSLSLNSIKCKDTVGNDYIVEDGQDVILSNNSDSINFSTRAKGKFYLSVGLLHGGNANWRDGKATAIINDVVETAFNFYAPDGPFDYADRLISWDSSIVSLQKYDSTNWHKFLLYEGAQEDAITYKFGVYKEAPSIGVVGVLKLNSLTMEDFDWYDTADEALTHGKIAAMYVHDTHFGFRAYTRVALKFLVDNKQENIGKVAVFRQYCTAKTPEQVFKPFNRDYTPTVYDEEGKATAHSPSEIGESLLVLGLNSYIDLGVTDTDINGESKKAYDVQDGEIHLKTTPTITSGSSASQTDRTIDSVKVIVTLPSGLSYKKQSANKEPQSVVINQDGTTTITWEYLNWQINHPAPEYPEITFTADISASLENNASLNIKSVIFTEEDIRDQTLRTANYGVIISNLAGSKASKSIDKPLVETNENFIVTNTLGNTSEEDLNNIKTIEILPRNNNGSSFHGSYTIKAKSLLNNQKLYYTTNSIDNIGITQDNYGKDTIKEVDLNSDTRWIEVTENDIIPSTATAIASLIQKVESKSEKSFKLEVIPENNKALDYYNFTFNLTSDNFNQAIKSNTVVSKVVSRTLSGLIFIDKNHNGIRDNSEELLSDVRIHLLKNNIEVDSVTTDNGKYTFTDLDSGDYKIVFDNISDVYGIINSNVGTDDKVDSDAIFENEKIVISVSMPEISDMTSFIYNSTNNDLGLETSRIEINKIDSSNIPLANAKFTIKKGDKFVSAIGNVYDGLTSNKQEYTTDDSGKIVLDNLPIGNYTVNETKAPLGYVVDNTNYNIEVKKQNGRIVSNKITVVNDINLKEVKLTVKHINKDDNSEIIPAIVNTYQYNSDYETNKLSDDYYQYQLVETQGTTSGKITEDTVVTYYYRLKNANINIKYVDAVTHEQIADSTSINTKYSNQYNGDEYESHANIPNNYVRNYTNKTDNYRGVVNQDTINIVYYYQKKDSQLSLDLEKTGTDKIISSQDKVKYKLTYKVKFTDYIGRAKIKLKDTLPYKINKEKSELNGGIYDEDKEIVWEENININSYDNDTVTITKNIELSYININPKKDFMTNSITATTIIEDKEHSITDKYNTLIDIKGDITVKYLDKANNKEISDSIKTKEKIGNTYNPIAKDIVGYVLVQAPEKDEYEYKEEPTELKYFYEKIKLKVETKKKNNGGNIVGNEEVLYGDNSTKDKIQVKADKGYLIDKVFINGKELKINDKLRTLTINNFIKMSENKLVEVSFKKEPLIVKVPNTSQNSTTIFFGLLLVIISLSSYYVFIVKKNKAY